ncbi:hypothetical protein IFT48_04250 [Pseudomonas fluorescens]|uniref:hypothetical protein n=1 Tax=Pseudomonas TaxID=286 RepID=UPI000F03B98C|nr:MULTISPECIES: hypothetical protein [Pseudomonas]MBD8089183.1 hypothetical protein [Pseudomonas fluorescens]MBD8615390.1 hypothetical protein [Pseudomonas putida]MBD8681956.1 hypothetical protein [Pseudomonas sp. CFBP 13719]
MSKVFSVTTPKDSEVGLKMDIRQADDGKWRAFIKETKDGVEVAGAPVRVGFLEKIGEGDNGFMVIRAALRVKNEDGSYQTRARQKDGKFLDALGKEVDSEDKAAREYVLMSHRADPTKLVFGQIATINVKNLKADKVTPTVMTLLTFKLYSDDEALDHERRHHKLQMVGKDHADYADGYEELKKQRKVTGKWADFFIASGHDVLREMGFSIRERARKGQEADMSPSA